MLTAYLLSVADEAARAGLPMRLPEAQRAQMERGLTSFVEGRITPPRWAPASASMDLDVRKLAALEALSRTGHAQARMLGSIQILPAQWPTSALIDWLALLSRVPDIPRARASASPKPSSCCAAGSRCRARGWCSRPSAATTGGG